MPDQALRSPFPDMHSSGVILSIRAVIPAFQSIIYHQSFKPVLRNLERDLARISQKINKVRQDGMHCPENGLDGFFSYACPCVSCVEQVRFLYPKQTFQVEFLHKNRFLRLLFS